MPFILPQLLLISQSDWLIYRCLTPDNAARVNVSRNAFLDLYCKMFPNFNLDICSDFTVDDDITNISDDISDDEIISCVNNCSNLKLKLYFLE